MNNTFVDKIKPDVRTFIVSSQLLTNEDHKRYLIYDETHKVNNPHQYSFLDCKVEFIAFKFDSSKTITSIVLYILKKDNLASTLKTEFGENYSSSLFSGEMISVGNEKILYETHIWKVNNRVMLVAPYLRRKSNDSQPTDLIRIWIKDIVN